ncbi:MULTISPECIES: Na+/H+ antiporter NhaA [unclassified Actinomyces]|uniref:Na+/H+ antiporter NhaA n=1 Tax=unclassified Actinomyces TaxID=2609248 RepID=UPI0020176DC2|nr:MULTISPECIES: Na+/H+ antiporter NhaA [unclassified Actinomyces]MCL3778050.1 Na+/H+ antiporter NhaA [Actinomyces sp. AC-20-1]MCL3789864.1 Na+/H+ antiporter NhaA [Actinomyces sp. 187325]MCL3792019.1 Na+/H+ antiporter NhaA [Actinomyces sp. 186855]MCL3794721.1 Na+/H+ antiporter NhaA [Actinomyces sp. 217892]
MSHPADTLRQALRTDKVDEYLRWRRRRHDLHTNETYAAIALAVSTLAALVWANVGEGYHAFWDTPAAIALGSFTVELSLHGWVDEGLMTVFFFMVGLDVRRDLALGEMRLPGRALLPAAAAVGGLVVPSLLYLLLIGGADGAHAWGTVISTDTAFAIGMLALIGPRRAPRLKAFLLAFAVIDDIGALLVIAVFYSSELNLVALSLALVGLTGVWLMARRGVWRVPPYLLLGIAIWYALYRAGVHATLAGVLIALLMPVYSVRPRDVDAAVEVASLFRQAPAPGTAAVLREALSYSMPLNQRLSFLLPPYVNYAVVPLFALANAGVVLSGQALNAAASSRIMWAVIGGLVVGKLVGVSLAAGLVWRLVPGSRVAGLDMPRMLGLGALSGMGFTISLLVAGLALDDEVARDQARIGVLCASLLALGLATIIFRLGDRFWPLPEDRGETLARAMDVETDLIYGAPDAPNVLVNYADMTYEGRWRLVEALWGIQPLVSSGQLVMVLRHKVTGPDSLLAALALEAAWHQEQEATDGQVLLFPLHDAIASLRGRVTEKSLTRASREVGLDAHAMWERLSSAVDEPKVLRDSLEVDGLTEEPGEPVLYLNGRRLHGLFNRWTLSEAVARAEQERASRPPHGDGPGEAVTGVRAVGSGASA